MLLPEENTEELEVLSAPYNSTTSHRNNPQSRLPSVLALGSETLLQQKLINSEADWMFDVPRHTVWNTDISSVSENQSGSEYAKRETGTCDAESLRCCYTAAKHKCVKWKTPESVFTEDSSLSTVSKKDREQTCFNSEDIAYKPCKKQIKFQRLDETLSSSTFHDLLKSSWMSANLHCSMLHFNASEHFTFVERQKPNTSISTQLISSHTIPVFSEKHNRFVPRDKINAQQRNELFQHCHTRLGSSYLPNLPAYSKSQNISVKNEDFVRTMSPVTEDFPRPYFDEVSTTKSLTDAHKLTTSKILDRMRVQQSIYPHERPEMWEMLNQMYPLGIQTADMMNHTNRVQRVYPSHRGACKCHSGQTDSQMYSDGHCLAYKQQYKTTDSTNSQLSAQLAVEPKVCENSVKMKLEERLQDLYRFHLQLRCLRTWSKRLELFSQASSHDRRRVLGKALCALRWAVKTHRAQTDTMERRRNNLRLYQCFYQWKNQCQGRRLVNSFPDSHNENNTDALRKRLVQPSRPLLLMTACSNRSGLHVLTAAMIHHHLSVLYKHWVLWKQVCLQEQSAGVCWDRRLQSKAWTLWVLTWQREQLATHQHRLHLLESVWMEWKIRNIQKKLEKFMQFTQRSDLLYYFHLWQIITEKQRNRQKQVALSRHALHSWHCYVEKTKLTCLSTRASEVLFKRTLAVTFRKWKNVTERMQATRRCLARVRHLQDKNRLQTLFATWRHSTRALKTIQENFQRAQLIRCISAWRRLVERSTVLVHYCYQRKVLTVKTFFQQWSRALQLRSLHKDFIKHLFYMKQTNTGQSTIVGQMMEPLKWKTHISAEELSDSLLLYNTLYTWRQRLHKLQLAQSFRSACDRGVQRSVLLEWHRFSQMELSDQVLLFSARLSQLHPSSSDSPSSCPLMFTSVPQVVLLKALTRMMYPDLSLAFSQWMSVVQTNRELRRQADLCRNSWRCKELTVVFRFWRSHSQRHCSALQLRTRWLLSHCVNQWRRMVWHRRRKCMLEQHAMLTHNNTLLRHCFVTWIRPAVGPDSEQQNGAAEQMKSKMERHKLILSFCMWVTCARQNQTARALYAHTLENRVFSAWQTHVQVCQERQETAFFEQYGHLRECFSHWRVSCVQQQTADHRVQHTLNMRAKAILQRWTEHTHYKARQRTLLCAHVGRRKIILKRRSFLIWLQTMEHLRRAEISHQTVLKYRYFSQWLHVFRHHSELLSMCREMGEIRSQRLRWTAFSLWQLRLRHTHSHLCHIRNLIQRWRDVQLLSLSVRAWRERLVLRTRVRQVLCRWRQRVSRVRKQREITWRLRNMFLRWKAAFRQSLRSRDHCKHTQRRRILLAWHTHTLSAQRLRYREAWFQYSGEMRLLSALFMQWRTALIQSQQRRSALENQLIYQSGISRRAFHCWRAAATKKRVIRNFNNRLLRKCFIYWRESRDQFKAAHMFCVKKERNGAQLALRTWSLWAKAHKAQRQMGEAVSLWLEGRRAARTFHQWISVFQQHQEASQHRQSQLSHRMFQSWRTAVLKTQQVSQNAESSRGRLETQSPLRSRGRTLYSHQALMERNLSSLSLINKYFCLWIQAVHLRRSDIQHQTRCSDNFISHCYISALERQEELTHVCWTSWKSQTAASLLYKQQSERSVLQRAWLIWRKRHIRSRVSAYHSANCSRVLLAQMLRVWKQRALQADSSLAES